MKTCRTSTLTRLGTEYRYQLGLSLIAALVLTSCTSQAVSQLKSPPTVRVARKSNQASQVIKRDIDTLKKASYTVDYHTGAQMPDGTVLVIFHSLCTGSADGHCQAIDVFRDTAPRIFWHHAYAGVLAVHTLRRGFSVHAINYGPHDPLCCPSLPPITDTFTWTGSGFKEHGPEPNQPGS